MWSVERPVQMTKSSGRKFLALMRQFWSKLLETLGGNFERRIFFMADCYDVLTLIVFCKVIWNNALFWNFIYFHSTAYPRGDRRIPSGVNNRYLLYYLHGDKSCWEIERSVLCYANVPQWLFLSVIWDINAEKLYHSNIFSRKYKLEVSNSTFYIQKRIFWSSETIYIALFRRFFLKHNDWKRRAFAREKIRYNQSIKFLF